MFKIIALLFVATTPIGHLSSKASFETKAACEIALNSDEYANANRMIAEKLVAQMGDQANVTFECQEAH